MTFQYQRVLIWAAILHLSLFALIGPAFGQDTDTLDKNASALPLEKDIPYAEGGDQQKLDLYLPKEKGFTTFVFTYGGVTARLQS